MGLLIAGLWQIQQSEPAGDGRFVRRDTAFRNWVTPDGRPGPTGHDGFAAAKDRYHLYVSLACPWAHRTLIMRALKGLEGIVSLSVTNWLMGDQGWTFAPGDGVIADPLFSSYALHELYARADPEYTGHATVPVLWDRHTQTIVNNESADILLMFNSSFDSVGARQGNYYPSELQDEIDSINARIYETVNDGVYRAGFATTQSAYEEAVHPIFETFDWAEERLSHSRFLCGDSLTVADIRLFTSLVRFDIVYFGHFKCNLRQITSYPNLWAYTRDIFQWPGIGQTVNFDHIKKHYYMSHRQLNPLGIVPAGPCIDFRLPTERR